MPVFFFSLWAICLSSLPTFAFPFLRLVCGALIVWRRGVFSTLRPAPAPLYVVAGFALGVIVPLGGGGVSPREIDASRPLAGGGDDSPRETESTRRCGGEESETEGCRLG